MCTIFSFEWIFIEMGERNWIGCLLRNVGTIDGTQTGNDSSDSMVNRLGTYFEWLNRELLQIIFLLPSFNKNAAHNLPLSSLQVFLSFFEISSFTKNTSDGRHFREKENKQGFHLSLWALLIFKCSFEHIFPRLFWLVQILPFSLVNFFNPLVKILPSLEIYFSPQLKLFYAFTNLEDYFRILS